MWKGKSRFGRGTIIPSVRVADLSFEGKLKDSLLFLGSFSKHDYYKYYIKTAVFTVIFGLIPVQNQCDDLSAFSVFISSEVRLCCCFWFV